MILGGTNEFLNQNQCASGQSDRPQTHIPVRFISYTIPWPRFERPLCSGAGGVYINFSLSTRSALQNAQQTVDLQTSPRIHYGSHET